MSDHHKPISGIRLALAALLAAVLTIATGFILSLSLGLPASDAARWVEALATVAAFSAATVAAVLVARTVKIEQARERDREEEVRQAQAMKVAAWVEHKRVMLTNGQLFVYRPTLVIRNASDLPVYEVTAHITHDLELDTGVILPIDGPDLKPEAVVPPGDPRRLELAPSAIEVDLSDHEPTVTSLQVRHRVDVEFTDASGTYWVRQDNGILV